MVRGDRRQRAGWSSENEPNLGIVTDWCEAPRGAVAAVLSFDGQEHEVPVRERYFLFAAWDVPAEDERLPTFVRWVTSE